jgi:hypothetical protein
LPRKTPSENLNKTAQPLRCALFDGVETRLICVKTPAPQAKISNSIGYIWIRLGSFVYFLLNPDGSDRAPNLAEWQALLNNGNFAGPRDKTPTPPNTTTSQLI